MSQQNKSICPDQFDTTMVDELAVIECATLHNLPDEKEAIAAMKENLNRVKEDLNRVKEDLNRKMEDRYQEERMTSIQRRLMVEEEKKKNNFISRASAAVFGGLAVIAPMLIMSLHPTRLTQLLTASLFVISVAMILAWQMDDADKKDIIAATAAYAAVLVVFVGASTTTT
jgi:Flp pilus assembly protein TadB